MTSKRHKDAQSGLLARFVSAESVMLGALTVMAGVALFAIWLGEGLAGGATADFDRAVLVMLHPDTAHPSDPLGPLWLDRAAADFTAAGSIAILLALSFTVAGFLYLNRRRLEAAIINLAFFGGLAISESLKGFFGRERPPDVYRTVEALNASFPSGHALLAAGVYLTIGVIIAQGVKTRGARTYVAAVSLVLVILIGLTRIYLGMHWTTDVLAGWVAGGAWASLCCGAARILRLRRRQQ